MRLIDADELINQGYEVVVDDWQYDACNKSIDIDNIPTAYDIDKVVAELEENASRYTKKYVTPYGNNGYRDTKAISVNKAIEIVKKCGVGKVVEQMNKRQWKKQGTKLRHNGHYASYVALFLGLEIKGKPHLDRKWLKR